MHIDDLTPILRHAETMVLPLAGGRVRIAVLRVDDEIRIDPADVLRATPDTRSMAARADDHFPVGNQPLARLEVRTPAGDLPLVIAANDILFPAASLGQVLRNWSLPEPVEKRPHLWSYSELLVAARRLELACEAFPEADLHDIKSQFLSVRCMIVGAMRFGMRPTGPMLCWQRAWRLMDGEDRPLHDFRPDPDWDELYHRPYWSPPD